MKTFVEIHIPGAPAARHELLGERVTLGTGSEASIRLPGTSGFEAEQVELFTSERGVLVQLSTGIKASFVFEGAEHRSAQAPWGGEVFVANVRLTFLKDPAARRASPVLLLLAPVAFILLGLGAYQAATPDDASSHEVPAPPLFDEHQAIRCPEAEPAVAEHRARDDERAALAKQERSAFDATDGVDALSLFREARVCFELAHNTEEASRLVDEVSRCSGRLNEQYATLRLRLRVSLDKDRSADALAAVREMQALLAHQAEGPYRQWLTQLGRTLEHKVAQPGS